MLTGIPVLGRQGRKIRRLKPASATWGVGAQPGLLEALSERSYRAGRADSTAFVVCFSFQSGSFVDCRHSLLQQRF